MKNTNGKRNEKGTNRSISESFLFRSFSNFDEIVPAPLLLEKKSFRSFFVPHIGERVQNAFLNERVPPIPWLIPTTFLEGVLGVRGSNPFLKILENMYFSPKHFISFLFVDRFVIS